MINKFIAGLGYGLLFLFVPPQFVPVVIVLAALYVIAVVAERKK